jgi:hypothetical protein
MEPRLKGWVARTDQEAQVHRDIIYQDAVTVDVYRTKQTANDNPGFASEIANDDSWLKSINARFDQPRVSANVGATGNSTTDILAKTEDNDVKVGDLWRFTDKNGQAQFAKVITAFNFINGCDVGLKYGN